MNPRLKMSVSLKFFSRFICGIELIYVFFSSKYWNIFMFFPKKFLYIDEILWYFYRTVRYVTVLIPPHRLENRLFPILCLQKKGLFFLQAIKCIDTNLFCLSHIQEIDTQNIYSLIYWYFFSLFITNYIYINIK